MLASLRCTEKQHHLPVDSKLVQVFHFTMSCSGALVFTNWLSTPELLVETQHTVAVSYLQEMAYP